ncbi:hypothetical protein BP5796_06541 [Coleophoma crateriformis]|uniref:Glycoside hydrolase family 25 protein n=1 Tax=Coleophoma crateriformis TaxID=565419 RepID=A0A3D8RP34_9HELO|nr:hypothetical protein BP5796_06541 [Coleophoma crateriformis]
MHSSNIKFTLLIILVVKVLASNALIPSSSTIPISSTLTSSSSVLVQPTGCSTPCCVAGGSSTSTSSGSTISSTTSSSTSSSTSTQPTSGVSAVDISVAQSQSFWTCAAKTYKVVVIRGYQQACGFGGKVDVNFLPSYQAAKAAGVPRVDAYLFPCTGTQPGGVPCKTPQTQLNEFLAVIKNNKMAISHLWFDIEPTSTASGGPCNAWQLSAAANVALAKQWVALLQQSGYSWGIYANGNQWAGMFGSRSANIASQLPLWAVQADGKPGVDTVTTFMGGWTSAFAKQYKLDTTGCGGSVDLDSFDS